MNLPAEKYYFMNTSRRIDELAKINKQARDDNGPGAEHVVKLEEVQDLDHAEEEGPGQELISDVEEDVGVVSRDEEESQVESNSHRTEEDDDRPGE